MWDEDWARLGVAPTTELATIKKAYALKLKVTRPDDDAEAYQALRAAYERIQQWLRWQQQEARRQAEADGPQPQPAQAQPIEATPVAPASVTAEPAMEPTQAPAAMSTPEHVVHPRHLVDELELRWRRVGEAGLLDAWQDVRHELDQQPLTRQAEFSAAFAQWVLARPALPDDFVKALEAHFGWLGDFRTERLLGSELALALHQALEERLRPRPIDPAVRAVGEPLLRLEALRQAGGRWWLRQWLCFLLQPMLARAQAMLGGQWLGALGLDLEAQRWLQDTLKRALWQRIGVAMFALVAGGVAVFDDPVIAGAHALLWLGMVAMLLVLGLAGGRLLTLQLQAMTPSARRWTLRLPAWCRDVHATALGLVWLLFGAWLFYLDAQSRVDSLLPFLPDETVEYTAWAFALGGLVLARPRNGAAPFVLGALAPLAIYLAVQALDRWMPLGSCVLVATAWLLAGAALHDGRFGTAPPALAQWLLRPVLNTLALAERWTLGVAMTPLAVALGYVALAGGELRPLRLFATWVVSILAVGWLQAKAEALALRQLPARAEAP